MLADGARAKSRSRSIRHGRRRGPRLNRHLAAACGRSTPSGGASDHVSNRDRLRLAHRLPAVLGHPELLLDHAVAAPRAIGRAVAHAGRGADPAVAAQARHRADDRELRRSDGDRPRYRGISVYDLPQSALVGDRCRLRYDPPDVRAVVARSVPHPPPAGVGLHAGMSCRAGRICLRMAR